MGRGTLRRLACTGLSLVIAPAAHAQHAVPPETSDGANRIDVTLYGWLAGASGRITPFTGAPALAFDNGFGDVLEDLDAALFASVHARRGNAILFADLSYAALSREGRVPPGIPAEGRFSQFSLTAAAGVRVVDQPDVAVDLLGGARLWSVNGSADVPLAGLSASPDKTFVDPVVGARAVAGLAPRLSALGYVDLGGVGIGSDFTYQVVGTLNYRVGDSIFLSVGYRHLSLDYRDGGTVFDGGMTGPLLGVTKRF